MGLLFANLLGKLKGGEVKGGFFRLIAPWTYIPALVGIVSTVLGKSLGAISIFGFKPFGWLSSLLSPIGKVCFGWLIIYFILFILVKLFKMFKGKFKFGKNIPSRYQDVNNSAKPEPVSVVINNNVNNNKDKLNDIDTF